MSAEEKVRGKGREEVSGGENEENEVVGWTTVQCGDVTGTNSPVFLDLSKKDQGNPTVPPIDMTSPHCFFLPIIIIADKARAKVFHPTNR
jgi:hypothetical protein